MGKLKKLEKLKLYALQIDIQPKRLLTITSNEGSDNFFNFYNFRTYETSAKRYIHFHFCIFLYTLQIIFLQVSEPHLICHIVGNYHHGYGLGYRKVKLYNGRVIPISYYNKAKAIYDIGFKSKYHHLAKPILF